MLKFLTTHLLLRDNNIVCILFQWIAKAKSVTKAMEKTWAYINQIKQQLCELVENDNDG